MESPSWQLAAPGSLACREWEGEAVVFDERSGATHRLAAAPTLLFSALLASNTPLTLDALIQAVFPESSLADGGERDAVVSAIAMLERQGLILAAPP